MSVTDWQDWREYFEELEDDLRGEAEDVREESFVDWFRGGES